MTNNEFDPKNGEKSSLSDMINEYESDNALRDKIEAAKKRKAMEEEALRQAEIQRRLDDMKREKEMNSYKEPVSQPQPTAPFIKADADATQVFSSETVKPLDDGDKTLVIMDNMKQRNFSSGTDTIDTSLNKKILEQQTERLAPEFEVEGEKITEKDIEEYLPKDNKKAKKPSNPDKTNKIITYTIAGIAGLCVIGLIVFALNFFGVFGGGDEKSLKLDEVTTDEKVNFEEIGANNFTIKDSEVATVTDATLIKLAKAEAVSTEDQTKVQVTTVDKSALKDTKGTYSVSFSTRKGTKVTVKATVTETKTDEKDDKKEEETKKDNSAKISELEGQIKSNNDQIANLQAEITTLQNTIDTSAEAKAKIDNNYTEQLKLANNKVSDTSTKLDTAKKNLETANASKDQTKIDTATKELASAQGNYDTAVSELNTLTTEISNKKNDIDASVNSASSEISSKNASIIDLQNQIIDLQNQLNALK